LFYDVNVESFDFLGKGEFLEGQEGFFPLGESGAQPLDFSKKNTGLKGAPLNRHLETDAIVLRHYPVGEVHRSLVVLTPEHGLLSVIVHGAGRNNHRYKAYTQPFTGLRLKLYHDPVRQSYKTQDLVPRYQSVMLTTSIEKVIWANLWAEVLLYTKGGGGDLEVFNLFDQALMLLDQEKEGDWVGIQASWRFHQLMGWGPEDDLPPGDGPLLYSPGDGLYHHLQEGKGIPVLRGSAAFLSHTLGLEFNQAIGLRAQDEVRRNLKKWIFSSLEYHLERKIKTLETAGSWFF